MDNLNINDVIKYVEENIGIFHQKRLKNLENLKLIQILKRKNPYLFKAKNILTAFDLVKGLLDAHLSSQEETIFGDWLEGLSIFINNKVYCGWKSGITGIDLEFDKDNIRYIITIKSGPNWGNNSQIKKMISDFNQARKTLRTSNSNLNIIAINGCCYGKDNNPDKNGVYFKYCGQKFWEFISGKSQLYTDIIEPLGYNAKIKNQEFFESYAQILNKFTLEFSTNFCDEGKINWEQLVKFNSENNTSKNN
ncbi:MAG: cytosolic protein [Spirochaetes bacterium GWD1_27_9]|nr:MAG: cytosolic protein [Spirochaetes bacterium GWC1_27_15]OHD29959.1 MAG: cytosolic protein [Spirochaetes bacterium GWD1_27_9]